MVERFCILESVQSKIPIVLKYNFQFPDDMKWFNVPSDFNPNMTIVNIRILVLGPCTTMFNVRWALTLKRKICFSATSFTHFIQTHLCLSSSLCLSEFGSFSLIPSHLTQLAQRFEEEKIKQKQTQNWQILNPFIYRTKTTSIETRNRFSSWMDLFVCYLTMSERSTYGLVDWLIDIDSFYEMILFNKIKFGTQAFTWWFVLWM